jgi:hypothetical protein
VQPTSVSYRGRSVLGRRYVDAAWSFVRDSLRDEWRRAQNNQPRQLLDELLDQHEIAADSPAGRATFASNHFRLTMAPVERDPEDDETKGLRANYLKWLSAAPRPSYRSVRDESFPGIDQLPAPRPLLYLLVRHGLLLEYVRASLSDSVVSQTDYPCPRQELVEEELVGIDEADDDLFRIKRPCTPWDRLAFKAMGRKDFDAQLANRNDFLQADRTFGAYLESLRVLSELPVRKLERLLAEALDVCSHRLDAWATSIASRRLDAVRRDEATTTSIHLAGWGAVFDLEPDQEPLESEGFVHAPSPTHATTAAILASGYLTHEAHTGSNPFAIDFSSERVRLVLWLLDGVRQGQPLGALLGYRFELGLHERGLDRYVDDFRRFAPLPSGVDASGAPGGALEAIAARNVVDGLELQRRWVDANRQLGAAGWPEVPAPGRPATDRAGVEAALTALDDAVDAVGEALLSEGVFQAVRGNPARAAAAMNAAAGQDAPPGELEVAQTPRSGLGVMHRLLLVIPEGPPLPRVGWEVDSTTPRAAAEPRLDAWAARLLGDPRRVVCEVEYVHPVSGEVLKTGAVKLHQLEPALSPLDVLYAAEVHDELQRSEIEQRFLFHATRARPMGVPEDALVRLKPGELSDRLGEVGLLELMEVARAGREAIAASRPFTPVGLSAPGTPAAATLRVEELELRARHALGSLHAAAQTLDLAVSGGGTEELRAGLLEATRFGVPGAVPHSAAGDSNTKRAALTTQVAPVLAELQRREEEAAPVLAELQRRVAEAGATAEELRDLALAIMTAVFGSDFRTLPLFMFDRLVGSTQLDTSFGHSSELVDGDPLAATVWLQRSARVRDGARRLADTLTYAEAMTRRDASRLKVAQLPAKAGDRWIGLPFANRGTPPEGRLSFAASLPFGTPAPGQALGGLLFDEWAEVVPSAQETTAVAFQFDRPNACAPQAIILAVPPSEEDWTLAALEATILQTLELAQARMVDLDSLQRAGHFLPAIYLGINLRGATVATDLKGGMGCPVS